MSRDSRVNYPSRAKRIVWNHLIRQNVEGLVTDDVYVVWFCYILGGWKALVSTTINDGRYYEVTYSTEKKGVFLDTYVKNSNEFISDGRYDSTTGVYKDLEDDGFDDICKVHNPLQHRDMKEPWCNACGLNVKYQPPRRVVRDDLRTRISEEEKLDIHRLELVPMDDEDSEEEYVFSGEDGFDEETEVRLMARLERIEKRRKERERGVF